MKALIFSAAVIFVICSASSVFATPIVIDNLETGYSETTEDPNGVAGWTSSPNLAPRFKDDVRYSPKPGDAAIWSFSGLEAGTYEVYATWAIHGNATTSATYTISNGGGNVPPVNQKNTTPIHDIQIPDGISDHWFQLLGTATVTDGTLEVTLTNAAGAGFLFADAIAITTPEPTTLLVVACGAIGIICKRRNR
ncbi:MAG: hypothetical protein KAR11_00400 [Phycisphaerae bacterium]|nr:hypothetical protein [Phycisphaerae bacterium]